MDVVLPGDRPPTDEELRAMRYNNYTRGHFHLMRVLPTPLEKK